MAKPPPNQTPAHGATPQKTEGTQGPSSAHKPDPGPAPGATAMPASHAGPGHPAATVKTEPPTAPATATTMGGQKGEPAAGFSTPGGQPLSAQPSTSAPNPVEQVAAERGSSAPGPSSAAASGAPPALNAPAGAHTTVDKDAEVESLRSELAQERSHRQRMESELARIDDLIREKFAGMAQAAASGAPPALNAPAPADADKVLIVNVGAAPIYVPDVVLPDGRALTLSPGVNPIPKATWEQAKKRRTIRRFLEAGAHLLATSGLREAGAGDIAQLGQDQALLLMSQATDMDQLGQWLQRESRPLVKAAGERQMEILRQRHAQIAEQMAVASKAGEVKTARRIG